MPRKREDRIRAFQTSVVHRIEKLRAGRLPWLYAIEHPRMEITFYTAQSSPTGSSEPHSVGRITQVSHIEHY